MDKLTRRALLRALAGGALSTVGTVILARTSLAALGTPEDTNSAGGSRSRLIKTPDRISEGPRSSQLPRL